MNISWIHLEIQQGQHTSWCILEALRAWDGLGTD